MKVLIFLRENKLAPRGGPYAVGYYINHERISAGDTDIEFLPKDERWDSTHEKGRKITSKLPKWFNNLHRSIRRVIGLNQLLNHEPERGTFDYSGYDIVHFHESLDLYKQRGNLENYKGTVVFMSHSPLPFSQEHYYDVPKFEKKIFRKLYDKTIEMDRFAFTRANYVIFPCEYAEEPYATHWNEFDAIKGKKENQFKYVLTGIPGANAKRSKEEVLNELGIEQNKFIVSYVGRHNEVKGFGRLLKIGKQLLSRNQDVNIIVAGREDPMRGLSHERWTEIGWTTDPHSYIAASDVFVLPNQETYFDIVMLEVLSLGCIVVASRTGGNKFFEFAGVGGVFLFDTEEDAVELIEKIKAMSCEKRNELNETNRAFYEKHLTSFAMYHQYRKVLEEIYKETHL